MLEMRMNEPTSGVVWEEREERDLESTQEKYMIY